MHFNTIPLNELLNVPTYTSARIFEILFHDSFGAKKTPLVYELDDLRKRLGIDGKYLKFADFRYILDRGMRDLKEWTRIEYEYAGIRNGLAYDHVRFDVRHNLTFSPKINETAIAEDSTSLIEQLKALGFAGDSRKAVERYGTERIRQNLMAAQRHILDAVHSAQPVKDPGWLIAYMIEHNSAEKQAQKPVGGREGLSVQQMQEITAVLETNYEAEVREAANNLVKDMSDTDLERLHNLMRVELDSVTLQQVYRHNWTGAVYETAATSVIYQRQKVLLPAQLQSFESWMYHEGLLYNLSSEEQSEIIRMAVARIAL